MFGPTFDYRRKDAPTVSELCESSGNLRYFLDWDYTVILPDGRTGRVFYGNRRGNRVYVKVGEGERREIVSLTSAEADQCYPLGASMKIPGELVASE